MNGYIKLFRRIKEWKWYKKIKTFKAFIHCLIEANYTDKEFEKEIIPRGSFLTSRKKFAEECGLTEQETRSAWTNLKSTNEITIKSTSHGTLITVVNYENYQPLLENLTSESTSVLTNNQPANNQQITTTKNNKEIKEYKEEIKKENIKRKKFVKPTVEEVSSYCLERGNAIDAQRFVDYYESKGWMIGKSAMKDWRAAIRTWERNDGSSSSKSASTKKEEKVPEWFNKTNEELEEKISDEDRRKIEEIRNGTYRA